MRVLPMRQGGHLPQLSSHDELHEVLGELDHAGRLVGDDHAARAHDGARGAQRVEVDGRVEVGLGQAAAERAAGLHGLEVPALGDAAADLVDDLAQRHAHGDFDQAGAVDHAAQRKDGRAGAALGAERL